MVEKGWIKLHRRLLDCWIWDVKPFDKGRAWVDLLLLAMHHDKKIVIEDKPTIISRGSYFTSRGQLADRWGWSVKKVDTYLKTLEKEEMVTTHRTPKGTTITIVNYEEYQIEGTTKDTTEDTTVDIAVGTTVDTTEGTTIGTAVDIQNKNIKNYKNVKNEEELKNEKNNTIPQGDSVVQKKKQTEEKHKYGEYQHVLLTDRQYEKLVNDYGEFEVQNAIKFLDEYIQMKGYKAKDHNLALRKWVFKAVEEEKNKNSPQQSRGNDYWAGI